MSYTVISNNERGKIEIHRTGCLHLLRGDAREPISYDIPLEAVIAKESEPGDEPDYIVVAPCARSSAAEMARKEGI